MGLRNDIYICIFNLHRCKRFDHYFGYSSSTKQRSWPLFFFFFFFNKSPVVKGYRNWKTSKHNWLAVSLFNLCFVAWMARGPTFIPRPLPRSISFHDAKWMTLEIEDCHFEWDWCTIPIKWSTVKFRAESSTKS